MIAYHVPILIYYSMETVFQNALTDYIKIMKENAKNVIIAVKPVIMEMIMIVIHVMNLIFYIKENAWVNAHLEDFYFLKNVNYVVMIVKNALDNQTIAQNVKEIKSYIMDNVLKNAQQKCSLILMENVNIVMKIVKNAVDH